MFLRLQLLNLGTETDEVLDTDAMDLEEASQEVVVAVLELASLMQMLKVFLSQLGHFPFQPQMLMQKVNQ